MLPLVPPLGRALESGPQTQPSSLSPAPTLTLPPQFAPWCLEAAHRLSLVPGEQD